MTFHIQMGLKKQKIPADNFNSMRRAILEASRDSGLIHACLIQAEHQGLSGEDTYTLLAFHSLQMLEEFWQRNMEYSLLSSPTILIKEPK